VLVKRALAVAALAVVLTAPAALAKRPASATDEKAIAHAVAAFVAKPKSPAAKNNRVLTVSVSTVNAAYAVAKLSSKSAGPSNALLHRAGATWKVVDFGSGAFPCKDASKAILTDLLGGCSPS
jgi:hypothetical protein